MFSLTYERDNLSSSWQLHCLSFEPSLDHFHIFKTKTSRNFTSTHTLFSIDFTPIVTFFGLLFTDPYLRLLCTTKKKKKRPALCPPQETRRSTVVVNSPCRRARVQD